MTLRLKVEKILESQPHTRNDDIELTLWVWYSFFQDKLEWQEDRWVVPLSNVRLLPSEDKISRIRRKFQELGQYAATDPVTIARREKETRVHETMSTDNWGQEF